MSRWTQGFAQLPATQEDAHTVLFGAPFDISTSGRPGARYAPMAIRQASQHLESYSPHLGQDILEAGVFDAGDVTLHTTSPQEAIAQLQEVNQQYLEQGLTPIMMGGDGLCSLPLFLALYEKYPDLMVIQLDAHTNFRPEYRGESHCHHTLMHHILSTLEDPQRIIIYGIRSGSKPEFETAQSCRMCGPFPSFNHQRWTALRYHLEAVHFRPILLMCDLDVFDPSIAPGTVHPEPGGITYEEFHHALTYLKGRNVVGVSVVGCCPPTDTSEMSSTLAAKVVRELSLLPSLRSSEVSNA